MKSDTNEVFQLHSLAVKQPRTTLSCSLKREGTHAKHQAQLAKRKKWGVETDKTDSCDITISLGSDFRHELLCLPLTASGPLS